MVGAPRLDLSGEVFPSMLGGLVGGVVAERFGP